MEPIGLTDLKSETLLATGERLAISGDLQQTPADPFWILIVLIKSF